MVIISLLDLPLDLPPEAEARRHGLETFVSGLPEYLSRCESQSLSGLQYILTDGFQVRRSKGVSLGAPERKHMVHMLFVLWHAYVYWESLKRLLPSMQMHGPHLSIATSNDSRHMDIPLLLSWLSARQYAPEGGFAGRTNKLVDGCYSHWVGGCWPLIQSALNGAQPASAPMQPVVGSLFSREGLTRYILACCQSKRGGLRDKPGKYVATPIPP